MDMISVYKLEIYWYKIVQAYLNASQIRSRISMQLYGYSIKEKNPISIQNFSDDPP